MSAAETILSVHVCGVAPKAAFDGGHQRVAQRRDVTDAARRPGESRVAWPVEQAVSALHDLPPPGTKCNHDACCVIVTTLSRTTMVPVRGAPVLFGDTTKVTGLSPRCGIGVVMVIHGAFETAVH
jgi:hypothetical protein